MTQSEVTIIIPTTCEIRRAGALRRAIASVIDGSERPVDVLIVANGTRVDEACLAQVARLPGVRIHRQTPGSLPLALRTGRSLVDTDFFGFLDDDDEYLPGAVAMRLAPLLADPAVDYVATNGVRVGPAGNEPVVRWVDAVREDPLAALSLGNWLASCGGMFRTAAVGEDFFDPDVAYLEWTYLAYRLALARRLAFVDVPTFRINDTAGSLSKSSRANEGELAVIERLLRLDVPRHVRAHLRGRLTAVHHKIAEEAASKGQLQRAWHHHLASLMSRGGWRFLPFTRKLIGGRIPLAEG